MLGRCDFRVEIQARNAKEALISMKDPLLSDIFDNFLFEIRIFSKVTAFRDISNDKAKQL